MEWCTQSENEKHAFRIGLKSLKGTKNTNSKLCNDEVIEIRRLHNNGISQKSIAKKFNIARSNVSFIVRNKTWKHT